MTGVTLHAMKLTREHSVFFLRAKSTFLHLIFSVGRVLVKLSVATTDGSALISQNVLMVLESQLPYKIVNLLFTITIK